MPNFEQRLVKTTLEGEKVYETPRPEDNEERLNTRMAKDFAIAEAMKRGASMEEIMAIENAPETAFEENQLPEEGKIFKFPGRKAA